MTTTALVVALILILISGILGGFGFYQDDLRKKKEKEQQEKLEKKVNLHERKLKKQDQANDENIRTICEISERISNLERKSDIYSETTLITNKLRQEVDAWYKKIEPRIRELEEKNTKQGRTRK